MDTVYPPSPQWYQPHAACLCCLSEDAGWLVYSFNSLIHVINPFTLKYQGMLQNGHTAKITTLASRPLTPKDTDHLNSDEGVPTSAPTMAADRVPTKIFVASGGEDSNVVCWDISSMQLVASLKSIHQKAVKAVEWSGDGRYTISGDRGGLVVVWSPFNGQINKKQLSDKTCITCISASPTHPDTVAIGLEGGDVLICQANQARIVVSRRLYGHTDKIQSLSWQQPSVLHIQDYTFLASGSADLTIRTWDVERESSTHVFTSPDFDERTATHMRSKAWVPVAWASEGQELLSCSVRYVDYDMAPISSRVRFKNSGHLGLPIHGTLVRWSMQHSTEHFEKIVDGRTHDRIVYQIMAWPAGNFVFTISMDRKIIVWDLDSGRGIAEVDCIGGNVYTLDIGLQNPGRIAMGLGNETIKVWNTLSQEEPYENIMVERLQSRVRSVKWHPVDEETLCFGLENGKIGMIENIHAPADNNQGWSEKQRRKGKKGKGAKDKICQKQTIFQSYHEGSVTTMMWCSLKVFEAPVPELFDLSLRGATFFVVSCGSEGKIQVSDSSRPMERSFDLEVALQRQNSSWYQSYSAIKGVKAPSRRDFAIHPNEDLLAIGNGDGSLEVFELKYFKLVYVFQGHKRRINRLKWRCATMQSDGMTDDTDEGRAESYLLAIGSDDGVVSIHMLERFSAKAMAARRQQEKNLATFSRNASETETIVPTTYPAALFRYHSKGVSGLAWSPHKSSNGNDSTCSPKLVSSSFDGKAVVYQLELDTVVEGMARQEQCAEPNDGYKDEGTGFLTIQGKVPQKIRHRVIACYSDHQGQVLAVHWSMSDVDRIFSGGADWRTCCWDWKSHALSDTQVEALKRAANAQPNSKASSLKEKSSSANSTLLAASVVKEDVSEAVPQDTEMKKGEHGWAVNPQLQHQEEYEEGEGELEEKENDQEEEQEEDLRDSPLSDGSGDKKKASAPKRRGGASQLGDSSSKRARTCLSKKDISGHPSSSSGPLPSSKSTTPTITPKKFTLFPMSSAAFQVQSKEKVHLEIIRLTRNLFCRRLGQGGILLNEQEVEEARGRWRSMREFFEKDGEEQGLTLSRILGSDIDEMNLGDDEDKGKDQCSNTGYIGENLTVGPHSGVMTDPTEQPKEGLEKTDSVDKDVNHSLGASVSADSYNPTGDTRPLETWQGEDSTPLSGDLVFHGSRESVKALAEMEAEEMAKNRSQPNLGTIFTVGSGLGVLPVMSTPKQKGIGMQAKSKSFGQLGQIPVSYWLGDVSKIVDILTSLSETELGIHDWIGIALSPMGGVEAWKTIMARTAAKFESAGEIHAAALCYLGIGNVFEAVDAYRKQTLYREALMLLRIRLWDDDDERKEDEGEEDEDEEDEQDDVQTIRREVNGLENYSSDGLARDMPLDEQHEQQQPQQQQSTMASNKLRDLHARILAEWGRQQERRGLYEQACKCQLTMASVLKRGMLQNRNSHMIPDQNKMVTHATPSVGLQTLARRADTATLRTVAGLAILLQDPSREERVFQYETAIAHKRLLDRIRSG